MITTGREYGNEVVSLALERIQQDMNSELREEEAIVQRKGAGFFLM